MTSAAHLGVALITAHVVSDFALPGGRWSDWKETSLWGEFLHAALYGALTWLVLPVWTPRLLLLVGMLTLAHAVIDVWKARSWWPHDRLRPLAGLVLDQFVHLLALLSALGAAVEWGSGGATWLVPWVEAHSVLGLDPGSTWLPSVLTVVGAYALALPGGSVAVRALLAPYGAALPGEAELSLGRVIGYLERLILLTLLLLGEFAAMAAIVAAKSLIRIPSISRGEAPERGAGGAGSTRWRARGTERITTEYFLIGTLGSISVALLVGLLARRVLQLL